MKIPSKPFRDHINSEVTRLTAKFPKLARPLQSLKKRTLPRFGDKNLDFKAVQKALDAIVKDAEKLDTDGYLFAIGQQLTSQLDSLSRTALAEGVPVFPELEAAVGLPKTQKGSQSDAQESEPGTRTKFGGQAMANV